MHEFMYECVNVFIHACGGAYVCMHDVDAFVWMYQRRTLSILSNPKQGSVKVPGSKELFS